MRADVGIRPYSEEGAGVLEEYYDTLRQLTELLERKKRIRTVTPKELAMIREEIADVTYSIRCLEGRERRW